MLQYAVIAGLIQFAFHLMQISDNCQKPPHHNRTSSILYGWCDTGDGTSFNNSSPYLDPPIWVKDFEIWFVSPKVFIPLLCCSVFVRLGHWSLLILFCFLNSGFFVKKFCHIGQLYRVFSSLRMLTHFFTILGQLYCDVWSIQPSNHANWWL